MSKHLFILLGHSDLIDQLRLEMTNVFPFPLQLLEARFSDRYKAYESWDILVATFSGTCCSQFRSFVTNSFYGGQSIICKSSMAAIYQICFPVSFLTVKIDYSPLFCVCQTLFSSGMSKAFDSAVPFFVHTKLTVT